MNCASLSTENDPIFSETLFSEEGVKFTGKEWDEDAGLYYYNARWYDANSGRFTSEDPIRDGLNYYVYVNNNPVNFVDPTGLEIVIEGDDEFVEKTEEALEELKSEPKGKELVEALESSENIHTIIESEDGNYAAPEDGYEEGTGADSTVGFNPDKTTGGTDSSGSNERPAFVGLGHELGHSEAIDNGTQNFDRGSKKPGTTPPCEENSMKRENEIRKEHGIPTRPSYY